MVLFHSNEDKKVVLKLVKVSTNIHSNEIENNHLEDQIKCQKSIKQIFCIPLQLQFAGKITIAMKRF